MLNSALFVLVGMQLPTVLDGLDSLSTATLVRDGALVAATVMAVRVVWVFPFAYGPRFLSRRIRERDPYPPWQWITILGWTGMRGAVSLAAALAVPLATDGGAAFPHREQIIFLAFAVILGTLLVQGLTLPALVHLLGVEDDTTARDREESKARIHATRAAIARIDELVAEEWVREETAERVRRSYDYRLRRFTARVKDPDGDGADYEVRSAAYQRLVREVLEAQRSALAELRSKGAIDDDLMHAIERELDYEDSRLEI